MKRNKLDVVLALALILAVSFGLLAGCATGSPAGTTTGSVQNTSAEAPVRIIVADAKTTHHLNLYVAKELGIFEKYNLDVEIVDVIDLTAARDLLISGEADVFWSCPTVAIAAIANGAPFKVIAQVKKPCTSVLVVPADSSIVTLSDLRGKNIAGISPTCEAVISLDIAARQAGGEFILQRLAGGSAIAALEAGSIDGAILEEPHVSIAELKGHKILFPTISESIPCRTINASNRALAGKPDALKRLVEAVDEANQLILADPVAADIVRIAVQYTSAPEAAIINGNERLKFDIAIDEAGLIKLGDELINLENIRENPGEGLFAEEFKGITWN